MSRRIIAAALLPFVALIFVAARRRAVTPDPLPLDARRSFVVTDIAILRNFTFERVLDRMIARSGASITAGQLFRQWFDTLNPSPGLVPGGPHCDDGPATGIPRRCPVPEGVLAARPFAPGEYLAIALVNRFDLAPADGANCGQYRIVFARKAETYNNKLHIIFEASLPNRDRAKGLQGCRDVVQFWAALSNMPSLEERRQQLESFYFDGLPRFTPVIDPINFNGAGGIRTLHFGYGLTGPQVPRFYQYRVASACAAGECTMEIRPDGLENLPWGPLFDARDTSDRARRFRALFVQQIQSLGTPDLNEYSMNIPREFQMFDSNPDELRPHAYEYIGWFENGLGTQEGKDFHAAIQSELLRNGHQLSVHDILARSETTGCVGCHAITAPVGDGLSFGPALADTVHLDEDYLEDGEGGPLSRYQISGMMRDVFLPHRMEIARTFLLAK